MKKYLIGLVLLNTLGCQPPSQPVATSPNPVQTTLPDSMATPGTVTGALQSDVQLDRESYTPGQQIEVTVMATGLGETAWVGVVPSSIPHGSEVDNDDNDLGYVRANEPPLSLVAPRELGDYDVRLNDDDEKGKEVASRSFKVVVDPAPVQAAKLLWQPTGPVPAESVIRVEFEAPLSYPENAWIGIVPSATPHGEESVNDRAQSVYQHLNGRTRGRVSLTVPSAPGSYDVRMFDTDDDGKEVASLSFEVAGQP